MSVYAQILIAADRARSELANAGETSIFSPSKPEGEGWPRVPSRPLRRRRAPTIEALGSTGEADHATGGPRLAG